MHIQNISNNITDDELFDLLDQIDFDNKSTDIQNIENEKTYCKRCKSSDKVARDNTQGIIVCIDCGTILAEIFDESPEWKQNIGNDYNETVARCGNPTNYFLPQSSLGTTIACSNRNRIKILHNWNAMPYKERSLNIVLKEIQNKCRLGGIMKCIEDDSKILYKEISECKHLSGKNKGKNVIIRSSNRKGLIAACIFFACKRKGNTRSPKEIAKLFDLKYKFFTRGCKIFLKLIKSNQLQYDIKISNAEHFITRYSRDLHIKNEFINQAMKISKNIQKINITSMHTPLSVAIASILLIIDINKLNIDKKQLASKFNISEVTITKTFKKIEQYKSIFINDSLTNKIEKLINDAKKQLVVPDNLKQIYDSINNSDDNINNYENYKFKISDECIDEYINDIEFNLYEILSTTDDNYKKLISKINYNF